MRPKLLRITNPSSGTLVCDRARLADSFLPRLVGLLGEQGLERGDGLWITPSSGVHTWGMSFPIDIVALDGELRVVDVRPATPPWSIGGLGLKTRSVLELPPGQAERSLISIGDTLSIYPAWNAELHEALRATV